jgi:predicted adenylyl cyclase CyaB
MIEVEKRAILNEMEFKRIRKTLDKKAKFIAEKTMNSFLFNKPYYLRIRLIKGQDKAIVTHKSEYYHQSARKETEFPIELKKINSFLAIIREIGFKECVEIKAVKRKYKFSGFLLELNHVDYFGNLLEVELMLKDKKDIGETNKKILEILHGLGLREFPLGKYKAMYQRLYKKFMRPVEEQRFVI